MSLLSASEMAGWMNRDVSTVRKYCQRKVIKGAFKIGRDWVISESDFRAYLESVGYPVDQLPPTLSNND